MSTLTSGEYDFLLNFACPVTEQHNPMMQVALEDRIPGPSSVSSEGDCDVEERTTPDVKQGGDFTSVTKLDHAEASWVQTEDTQYRDLYLHWHEPLMEGLLEPIINYLRSEGIQMASKDVITGHSSDTRANVCSQQLFDRLGGTTGRSADNPSARTVCLKDIERC